jgi:hypothetical protein
MWPMRNVALERVASGETTLQEVDRVLGDVPNDDTGHRDTLSRTSGPLSVKQMFEPKAPEPVVRERRQRGDRRRGERRREG